MDGRVRELLEEYYKLFPNEQLFPEWFDIPNREKMEMLNEAIKDKKDLSETKIFDKYQEKVIDDKYIGKLKYVGKSFGVEGLTNNKIYEVVSVEYPFFRIIDDSGEEYLYSIIKPSSLEDVSLCGKWQLIEDNKGLLKDYFKYTSYDNEIEKRLSEYIDNETKIISGMSEKEEWDYIKNEHKNEQIKTIYDDLKEKYVNMEKALNKAHELLNDKSLCILKYAETTDYYLFEYGTKDKKPLFDDTLIKVDKTNFVASYYNIVEHLKEVNNLVFIEIK